MSNAVFNMAERFEYINAALNHTDERSRKNYIEDLNKLGNDDLLNIENAIDADTLKYINAEIEESGTWDEIEELDIAVNVMDAAIDATINPS